MKRKFAVLFVLAVLAGAAHAQTDPEWVYFESRESALGPKLILSYADGKTRTVKAAADSLLIKYIANTAFGGHEQLSVDRHDRNRVLLRFDLSGVGEITYAALVLHQEVPPRGAAKAAFDVILLPAAEAWLEHTASWRKQPATGTKPIATVRLEPESGHIRIPITETAKRWIADPEKNHGLLIRTKDPVPWVEPVPAPAAAPPPPPLVEKTENGPTDWIFFHAREKAKGPRLVVVRKDGRSTFVGAVADSVLISYLSEKAFGGLLQLSVSLNDSNRVLLRFPRFDLEPGDRAELILSLGVPERLCPVKSFDVSLTPVTEAWDEAKASWETQPGLADAPLLTFRIYAPIEPEEIRIDVTKALAFPHGFALRVAKPLAKPPVGRTPVRPAGPTRPTRPARTDFLSSALPWAPNPAAAFGRAKKEGRFVMAFVQATAQPTGTTYAGDILLSTVLADPDVRALIDARFVPVKTGYHPQSFTTGSRMQVPGLRVLVADAKAPALVLLDAEGGHLATLASIGTFDKQIVLDFLREVLPPMKGEDDPWALLAGGDLEAARKKFVAMGGDEGRYGLVRAAALRGDHPKAAGEADKIDTPEARVQFVTSVLRQGLYLSPVDQNLAAAAKEKGDRQAEAIHLLACWKYRTGYAERAMELWRRVVAEFPDSPWALPARCRLAWPERTAMYDSIVVPDLDGKGLRSTERTPEEGTARFRALNWLLNHQRPDGTWSVARPGPGLTEAVTALVAQAIFERLPDFEGRERKRLERALARAEETLVKTVRNAGAESFNSFAAAYLLDYRLDRLARDPKLKEEAQKAVDLLLGGQCPNGAWSYDRRFATTWRGGFGGWPETDKGRVHSMNTGPALVFLARAKKAGLNVPQDALDRGREALLKMKVGPAAFTYTWPDPISWEKEELNIGRAPACEQALWALGAEPKDLDRALANFMKYRKDLRGPVKLTPGWTMPRGVSSYFYFFAYYHAARAIADRGGADAKERLAALRAHLLEVTEIDGTWVDYPAIGKAYGTAMALRVMRLAEEAGGK